MKVAVAGLGWWGKQLVRSLAKSSRFELVMGMEPHQTEEVRAFAAEFDLLLVDKLTDMLDHAAVQGVILATPHALHEDQVLAALDAGKQVFCEKPLAMTSAGARRMLDAASRHGRVLGIGHERRFEPAVTELIRSVRAGEIGRLLHLEANVSHDLFRKLDAGNWRLDPKHAPAGMLTAVGIHLTDIFVALAGPAASVNCHTDSMVLEPPAQDYISAAISFRSGARATITFLSTTPFHGRLAVFGDRGWIELVSLGNVDQGLDTIFTHCTATAAPRIERRFQANDAVLLNLEAWAEATAGGARYAFTTQELLENIQLFEAIVASGNAGGASVEVGGVESRRL